jgi:MFS family permease
MRASERVGGSETSQETHARRGSLLGLGRGFAIYWNAALVSSLGSGISLVALPLLAAVTLHAQGDEVGALRAAESAPYIALALVAGVLADRLPPRRLMIAADLARGLLIGAIPVLVLTGSLTLPALFAIAAGVGSFTVVFDVGQFSLLGQLVDGEHLLPANRAMELVRGGSSILGPSIGGLLVALLRAYGAVVIDAVSYLASAVLLVTLPAAQAGPTGQRSPQRGRETSDGDSSDDGSIWAGTRRVLADPYLRPMTLYLGLNNLLNQAFMTAIVVFLAIDLRAGATSVGLVFGAFGVGFCAGAVAAPWAGRAIGLGRIVCLSSVIGALGILLVALSPAGTGAVGTAIAMTGTALVGLSNPLLNVQSVTLRLAITPAPVLGRVNAVVKLVSQGAVSLGALLGGFLITLVTPRGTFAALSAASLAATGILFFSAIRPLRRPPDDRSKEA